MAYSIGPKFNNAYDASNIANIFLEGDKVADERNRKNFDNMMTGLKGIGKGVGAARQYIEADKIKQANLEKLKQLQDLRDAANEELVDLNAMRDEAKGTVVGIDNMLLDANGYPSGIISRGSAGYPDTFASDGEPQDYKALEEMEKFYKYGRRAGL